MNSNARKVKDDETILHSNKKQGNGSTVDLQPKLNSIHYDIKGHHYSSLNSKQNYKQNLYANEFLLTGNESTLNGNQTSFDECVVDVKKEKHFVNYSGIRQRNTISFAETSIFNLLFSTFSLMPRNRKMDYFSNVQLANILIVVHVGIVFGVGCLFVCLKSVKK